MNTAIDAIIWEADADTLQFRRVEGCVEEILGFSADDWLGRPDFWQSKLHPDDSVWVVEACLDASSKRQPHRLTYRMLAADGRAVWLQDNVKVMVEGDQAILCGIMIDVTELVEQRHKLATLNTQNDRFRALYDLVPVAIWEEDWSGVLDDLRMLRSQGVHDLYDHARRTPDFVDATLKRLQVVSVNRAAVEMFGAESADELIRRAGEVFIADRPNTVFLTALDAIMQGQREIEGVNILRRLSGETVHVMYRVALPTIEDRSPLVVICEMDVTAEHIAQERFELVTRTCADVIWDFDLINDKLWASDGLKRIFDVDPEPMLNGITNWTARVHAQDVERVTQQFEDLLQKGRRDWKQEYRFRRGDGSYAMVRDEGSVLFDGAGRPIRMVGSVVDITDQHRLEEQLRQSQKLEAVGQLTGGVAHDFNNLLTVIIGNAEVLSDRLQKQHHLRKLAEMTLNAAERGAELTNRLLAFSRKQTLVSHLVDVNTLARGVEGLLRRTLPENIDIEIICGKRLWQTKIDPGALESALLNLALNARDAMPEGGRLSFETGNVVLDENDLTNEQDVSAGQYVAISVTDTGHGIHADMLGRVFEPFYTTKDIGKGSGLGLSMVYGFVKQSGGHIRVFSELGKGTTFKLYFPRSKAMDGHVGVNGVDTGMVGGDETILVVEDDGLVRETLIAQLKDLGYRVLDAAAGPQALEILHAVPDIDLLFTDVVMPGGLDGGQLADAARVMRPDLRVLFTSGYAEHPIVKNRRLARGVELLPKPYRRNEVAAKVRKVLDRP